MDLQEITEIKRDEKSGPKFYFKDKLRKKNRIQKRVNVNRYGHICPECGRFYFMHELILVNGLGYVCENCKKGLDILEQEERRSKARPY